MNNNTPVIYIDYVTREDGSQYHRCEYADGCVEITPRDVWIKVHPSASDSWESGLRGTLWGGARREVSREI